MAYPSIITGNSYRGYPLLPYDGPGAGYHQAIQDRIIDRFEFMLGQHSQVLWVHLIVRFPISVQAPEDNHCFQFFMEEYRRFLSRQGLGPHFVWVREKHDSHNPHYHLLLWLNGNAIRYYLSPEKADYFWHFILERTFGAPIPKHGLIEVAPSALGNHGVLIASTDEPLKQTMIQYSSYFAKLNTKGRTEKRIREFGCLYADVLVGRKPYFLGKG